MTRAVLITGCSDGGMGAALAMEFHRQGDRVFATARNPLKMASLKAAGIETLSLDVVSEDSIQACINQIRSLTGGSLDVLAKEVFDLNFWAVLRMSQVCLPLLQQAARDNGHALLVNQTSVSSVVGAPFFGAYNTSKAAAAVLIRNLRLELAAFGIKVIDLKTGGVNTNIHNNDPVCHLPSNSPYAILQSEIEKLSKGDAVSNMQDVGIWAKNVTSDLNKNNPSHIIWRGKSATQIWLASLLPITALDSTLKKLASLDMFEDKLKRKAKRSN
ncbi:1-acylglycerone phosphate reductase [Xylogone sp. PMI_703]|nr:1-acylglycerone phosphate reductase [Xylogone sp. PMI_703]